jgi:hypothetical protein
MEWLNHNYQAIGAVGQVMVAFGVLANWVCTVVADRRASHRADKSAEHLEQVVVSVNGRVTELNEAVKLVARAEGVAQERKEQNR